MVTKDQAMNERYFHHGDCKRFIGPRGGLKTRVETWRANGACKTWKTRPDEFRLPIKYGMYAFGYLTHDNADEFHTASECWLNHEEGGN